MENHHVRPITAAIYESFCYYHRYYHRPPHFFSLGDQISREPIQWQSHSTTSMANRDDSHTRYT